MGTIQPRCMYVCNGSKCPWEYNYTVQVNSTTMYNTFAYLLQGEHSKYCFVVNTTASWCMNTVNSIVLQFH